MGEVRHIQPGGRTHDDAPRHFVRVTCADHHGYIEFQFSIGDPEL